MSFFVPKIRAVFTQRASLFSSPWFAFLPACPYTPFADPSQSGRLAYRWDHKADAPGDCAQSTISPEPGKPHNREFTGVHDAFSCMDKQTIYSNKMQGSLQIKCPLERHKWCFSHKVRLDSLDVRNLVETKGDGDGVLLLDELRFFPRLFILTVFQKSSHGFFDLVPVERRSQRCHVWNLHVPSDSDSGNAICDGLRDGDGSS